MKKRVLLASAVLSLSMSIQSFAGAWVLDSNGWWWKRDDGSWPQNKWEVINDVYYYFGNDGYMLSDTWTPDGYYVDHNGAWVQGLVGEKTETQNAASMFDLTNKASKIKYTGHKVVKEYDGNDCLALYYDYTNLSDKAENAIWSEFYIQAFQNGIECNMGFPADRDQAMQNYGKDIMPGITINVADSYEISNKSDVTVMIYNQDDWKNELVWEYTFKLD